MSHNPFGDSDEEDSQPESQLQPQHPTLSAEDPPSKEKLEERAQDTVEHSSRATHHEAPKTNSLFGGLWGGSNSSAPGATCSTKPVLVDSQIDIFEAACASFRLPTL